MYVPADPDLEEWIELELECDVKVKRLKRGFLEIVEIESSPLYAKTLSKTSFLQLYNEIKYVVISMIKEEKYSKNEIVNEIAEIFGIHPVYSKIFVEYVMGEVNAIEDSGIVRR